MTCWQQIWEIWCQQRGGCTRNFANMREWTSDLSALFWDDDSGGECCDTCHVANITCMNLCYFLQSNLIWAAANEIRIWLTSGLYIYNEEMWIKVAMAHVKLNLHVISGMLESERSLQFRMLWKSRQGLLR